MTEYYSIAEWAKILGVSVRRALVIVKNNRETLGAIKMPGKTGAYLIPRNAPDPRKWTRNGKSGK